MHYREMHHHSYVNEGHGRSEYWEFSPAIGWRLVDKYEAYDWPLNTFRYVDWSFLAENIPSPVVKSGKTTPPRVLV